MLTIYTATTATTLGFDFVANPAIVALPDTPASYSSSKSTPSLLTQARAIAPANPPAKGRVSPALSTTPTTPALIPHTQTTDNDDLDDWEHIDALPEAEEEDGKRSGGEVDDDLIVLGEFELEDDFNRIDIRDAPETVKSGYTLSRARRGVTYAAAVGIAKQ